MQSTPLRSSYVRAIFVLMKIFTTFVCQSCGAASHKWAGQCDACQEWNTIVEDQAQAPASGAKGAKLPKGRATRLVDLKGTSAAPPRVMVKRSAYFPF